MKTEHNTNVNSDLSALSIIHLILREQYLKPQITHRLVPSYLSIKAYAL